MHREELAKSAVPLINDAIPNPEPPPLIETKSLGFAK